MERKSMKGPELVVPAGNPEKLRVAIHYGADAVYLGGKRFSLRQEAGNFTPEEMKTGIAYAHSRNVRVYVAVNIFSKNEDISELPDYLSILEEIGADAVIVSDPGVLEIVKETVPSLPIHLSTQANTTNWKSCQFWERQGISRICLARELSLKEIRDIRAKTKMDLELFVHGAMCISYSGRCLLSYYMTGRDANHGNCAQPCRWKYSLMEEKREGEFFAVEEDKKGTYIFNSKDLCMIEHIPLLMELGVKGFKIEGRMKSINYLSTVTHVYRQAIDLYLNDPKAYRFNPNWVEEIKKVSNRQYTTGFYLGKPGNESQNTGTFISTQQTDFVGVVRQPLDSDAVEVEVKNKIVGGEWLEFFGRNKKTFLKKVDRIEGLDGGIKEVAQPNERVILWIDAPLEKFDIIRRIKSSRQ